MKKWMLSLGLCALLSGCSTGGPGSDSAVFGQHETHADKGARYLLGRGVPQNDANAFYYFDKAAASGDPFAENQIAYLYASGRGTPRDEEKAFYYYEQAANKGLASAQYNAGLMTYYGIGTARDRAKAMQWFKKSAGAGFEPAKLALKRFRS